MSTDTDEADDLDGEEPFEADESAGPVAANPPAAPRVTPAATADPAADPAVEERRLRRRLVGSLAVLAVAVAALGLMFPGHPVRPGAGQYRPASADPIGAALPVLRAFVERTRGLTFARPVTVTVLAPPGFARAAAEPLPNPGAPGPPADRDATERALRLGHLAPGGTTTDSAAFYSYSRHQVYLRAGPFDSVGQAVLVHELTHALQDQRFDLLGMARRTASDADRARALAALIEGDATRVELAWVATRSAAEQERLRPRLGYDRLPASYAGNVRYFPYTYGRDFVGQLAASGGNRAVDAAFGSPPVSTAQIMDPRLYRRGVLPLGVRPPQAEGPVVDSGTLGRFGLAMLSTRGRRVLNAGAASAWQGDAYLTYRSGPGFCTKANVIVADSRSRQELLTDLSRLPGRRFVTPFGADTLRFGFCT